MPERGEGQESSKLKEHRKQSCKVETQKERKVHMR